MTPNIGKKQLWRHVNIKINRSIHHYHVFAVLNLLFEELMKDLADGKQIEIIGLGKFGLKQGSPRNFFNIWTQKMAHSAGHKILKFTLTKKLQKTLRDYWDLDKPLTNGQNE